MTGQILFICAQNVCRSAYLEYLIADQLGENFGTNVSLISRGTKAQRGVPMCDVALTALPQRSQEAGSAHRSQRLRGIDLASSDLILTATRNERGLAATLDPASRSRTFTVREALLLAELVPAKFGNDEAEPLRTFAEALHESRGLLQLPHHERRNRLGFGRKSVAPPLDIEDQHQHSRAAHKRLFSEMHGYATQLSTIIAPHVRVPSRKLAAAAA
ncbi:MAG: hypothetical protein QM607_09365 [Microbacterium sp.]